MADSRIDEIRRQFEQADALNQGSEPNIDAYRDITAETRERSIQRHNRRLKNLAALQTALRLKIFSWMTVLTILLLVAAHYAAKHLPDYTQEAPQSMAIWMEQQKMFKQIQQVQQWLQDGQAQSDKPPPKNMEDLQAWLDQIKLNPDLQKPGGEKSDGEPGFVPFQCAVAPVSCPSEDVPSQEGDYRIELSRLVRNANIMLADNGDCEGTVNLIREYGSLFGWRNSEAITKARTELSVARCFMNRTEIDTDSAFTHYQRTFCASVSDPNPDQAMNALYGLARIAHLNENMPLVHSRVDCSASLLEYHLQKATTIDTLQHYVSLALMHYEFLDDPQEAIRLQEQALSDALILLTTAETEDHDEHLSLILTLQLNLMEGYITINQSGPMYRLYDEVVQNPLIEDSDRLVALGMLVMQDLIDGNTTAAKENLNIIISRYKTLAEFNTLWSWTAFDRWQQSTKASRNELLDTQIRNLRIALSVERPPDSMQRLYQVLTSMGAG